MNDLDIFSAALDIVDVDARARFLDQACGDNRSLRTEIEKLLRSAANPDSFMESRAAGLPITLAPAISEQPGKRIGNYKLLQQIGEGGMGVVYMAEQLEPVRRKVAIKIIKPGMDSKQVIARFEAERQALALMDHPNISRVFEAGTTEAGRPYFVMELVKGVAVTDYCDEQNLPPQERLELFIPICQAVQHAHQKGIIHRDLKPTNVMITLHDGVPVPKIIDFGIAKAIDRELTERTMFTEYAQLVGTPTYMSPEQAEMSSLDVDTRSDIYSLGVLLYELLTGTTPFDKQRLREAAFDEMRRIIREEEPVKPSTRISTLGKTLKTVSSQRRTDPKRLGQLVRGDLDWIVMKALDKNRGRRYESASEFAADVKRHLNDEPVIAGPPGALYKTRKFLSRQRGPVTIAAVGLIIILLGLADCLYLYYRAERMREAAVRAQARAAEQSDRLRDALIDKGSALSQREAALNEKNRALDEKTTALNRSEGLRLATQSLMIAKDQPELAGALAVEAARRTAEPLTYRSILTAMKGLNVARRLTRGKAWIQFTRDGQLLSYQDHAVLILDVGSGQSLASLDIGRNARRLQLGPRGQRLAVIDEDQRLQLWNLENRVREPLEIPRTPLKNVAFSPNGQNLAAVSVKSDEPFIFHWNLKTKQGGVLEAEQAAWLATYSGDGEKLLTVPFGKGVAQLWSVADGESLAERMIEDGGPWPTALFTPDGKRVLYLGGDSLRVWDLDLNEVKSVSLPGNASYLGDGCDVRLDHGLLLTWSVFKGSLNHRNSYGFPARLWDISKTIPELKQSYGDPSRKASFAALSPDARFVAVVLNGTDIELWSTHSGKRIANFVGRQSEVIAIAVRPGGKTIATVHEDGVVSLWDADNRGVLPTYPHEVWNTHLVDQGDRLAVLNWGSGIDIMDARTLRPVRQIPLRASWKSNVRVSSNRYLAYEPENKVFAARTSASELWIVSQSSGEVIQKIEREFDLQGSTSWEAIFFTSPDTLLLIYVTGEVELLNPHTGSTIWRKKGVAGSPGWMRTTFALSSNGERLLLDVGRDPESDGSRLPHPNLHVYDARTGKLLQKIRYKHDAQNKDWLRVAAFGPDGRLLATAFDDEVTGPDDQEYMQLQLWEVETGRQIGTLPGQPDPIWLTRFSPDGEKLLSATGGEVRIWNVAEQTIITSFKAPGGVMRHAVFSSDGTRVAVGGGRNASLWNAETGENLLVLPEDGEFYDVEFAANDQCIVTIANSVLRSWPVDPLQRMLEVGSRELSDAERDQFAVGDHTVESVRNP